METLEKLKSRIESTRDMQSVVRTMKSLAAVNIREYEQAVESTREYSRTVELGMHTVMRLQPEERDIGMESEQGRAAAVVFGSEQGMAGRFNQQLTEYAAGYIENNMGQDTLIVSVSERMTGSLEHAGYTVEEIFPMSGPSADISSNMHELAVSIGSWRGKYGVRQIILFHNTPSGGSSYEPNAHQILPLSAEWLQDLQDTPWPSESLPLCITKPEELFSSLVHEFIFISLYRTFIESLASENASRLAAMQAAEKNIEDRLGSLMTRYHGRRQSAITAELLDITAGFEAIKETVR